MSNFKDKIDKVKSKTPSKWRQNAAFRLENRWLEYSSQIARRILAIIRENDELNQTKLADMLGVTPQQITKIIKGKENLTLETIYKLSKALKFELITFPEYKYSKPIMVSSIKLNEAKVIDLNSFVSAKSVERTYSVETSITN
jgi:transcriptional regulator with XRE-family HTH domain